MSNRPFTGNSNDVDQAAKAVHVVNVADMKVSARKEDTIITYALGSCLGITVYDPVACIGGMLHAMLPVSAIDSEKAELNPFMFVDTGVPELFRECYRLGGQKERLIVKVAGGACARSNQQDDYFQIGKRNLVMFQKLLWKNGVLLSAHDVGGSCPRTMILEMENGDVSIKSEGSSRRL
jgi:chemotaxis protein CheD